MIARVTCSGTLALGLQQLTPQLLNVLQVLVALDGFKSAPPAAESDLAPVQGLLNEAYSVIDRAVSGGVLHRNTAARRKARMAKARRMVLISAGLYTPAQ